MAFPTTIPTNIDELLEDVGTRDLHLEPTTGEIVLEDGKARLTELGGESIAQRIRVRLLFFFGEWVLNREEGTRWFERILVKGVDKNSIDQELKTRVLDTREVVSIEYWDSTFNTSTRQYDVNFSVFTTFDTSETIVLSDFLPGGKI